MNLAKPVKNIAKQIKIRYDTHIYNKQSKSKDREHF